MRVHRTTRSDALVSASFNVHMDSAGKHGERNIIYSAVIIVFIMQVCCYYYTTLAEFKYQRTQCSFTFVTPEKHSALDSAPACCCDITMQPSGLVSAEFSAA